MRWIFTLFSVAITAGILSSTETRAADKTPGERLQALFDTEWEYTLKEYPTFASSLGDLRYNKRWPDVSLSAMNARNEHARKVLSQLDAIGESQLNPTDRLNARLFRRQYENDLRNFTYGWHLVPLNQREGIQDANSLADELPFRRVKDYEDWLARLTAFHAYMQQTIELMREGIRTGRVHPKIVMQRLPAQIERQIVADPTQSLFYSPFKKFPDDISADDQRRLSTSAQTAIRESVVPAFREMLTFFNDEYLPACFDKVGVWQWPKGQEFYAARAREFTTTSLTPQEIHDIGQSEVKRIRAEMEEIIQQVTFQGTFKEFLEHLRTDPKFYYKNANELLDAYRAISKRVDPELVRLFRQLPRIPYGVEPIPMHIAPDTTTAYYRPPAADGTRAGTYFVNLYRPEVRPKYEIEALSLHEAVPGHHLQISLAMELENLPAFRRYTGYTAFVEGWGLYSESLGSELGLYKDPYSKFGQLTYEMWRAVRLVVDTGMHNFQWTRQEAIDFFAANTAKTMLDIENEIDRYIAWPGQALAYKIGELKIKELRKRAETKLGDKFDIRAFHDVVLASGAVTLGVLESNVDDWIASQQ